MNKIEFPRWTYDGDQIKEEELKKWYISKVKNRIEKDLQNLINKTTNYAEKKCLKDIKRNLTKLILASPNELVKYRDEIDKDYKKLFRQTKKDGGYSERTTNFCKSILDAFDYSGFQKTVLVELARKINVKTCPYCNMHYTLIAEPNDSDAEILTKFQWDHFVNKSQYPQLSMSLYNLIPSCTVCNQGKSTTKLSPKFNPYHSAINELFHFELENSLRPLIGGKTKDFVKIKLVKDKATEKEIKAFKKAFHLETLYSRHGDIVREVFDKAYESVYYCNSDNFKYLRNASPEYIQRLWFGTYVSKKEIEKRPMTKFIQDLRKQAMSKGPLSDTEGE